MCTLRLVARYVLPLTLMLAWCRLGSAATVVGNADGVAKDSCGKKGREVLYGFAISRLNLSETATIDVCTGGFKSVSGGPVPFFANSFAVATKAGYLYISNSFINGSSNNGSQIFVYSIDQANGKISQIPGSPFFLFPPPVSIQGLAATPDGRFLFGADASGNIFAFRLDKATGVPTSLPGSPFASGPNSQLVVDPSGKFLYATADDAVGSVLAFAIDSAGALSPVPGSPFVIPSPSPVDLNSQPYGILDTGSFVYVALSATNQVAAFSVNSDTGALTHVPGSPFSAGNAPSFFAISHNFLYAVNAADGTVSAYSINPSSGALTPVPGSPFGSGGGTLAIDPSEKYLYLGTFKGVQSYDINSATGVLSSGHGTLGEQGDLWLTIVGLR
jgi:6-phosphogluconolactonase (cycloisomerase 2 family)